MPARDLRLHIIKLSQILVLHNPGSLHTTFGNYYYPVISTALVRPHCRYIPNAGFLGLWRVSKSLKFTFYFQEGSPALFCILSVPSHNPWQLFFTISKPSLQSRGKKSNHSSHEGLLRWWQECQNLSWFPNTWGGRLSIISFRSFLLKLMKTVKTKQITT